MRWFINKEHKLRFFISSTLPINKGDKFTARFDCKNPLTRAVLLFELNGEPLTGTLKSIYEYNPFNFTKLIWKDELDNNLFEVEFEKSSFNDLIDSIEIVAIFK